MLKFVNRFTAALARKRPDLYVMVQAHVREYPYIPRATYDDVDARWTKNRKGDGVMEVA